MTMEQKKVIRAAVLTPMFLLLAIGIFDARHGNLAAQGKTHNIASSGNMDFRKAEAGFPAERLATAYYTPTASIMALKVTLGRMALDVLSGSG